MTIYSPQPGARSLRSIFALIIVIILLATITFYLVEINEQFERVAVEKTISDINSSLSLVLYKYVTEKQIDKLAELEKQNPFIYLSIFSSIPLNYKGTIGNGDNDLEKYSWYFNIESRQIIYTSRNGKRSFAISFEYDDRNNDGKFSSENDAVKRFFLQELE